MTAVRATVTPALRVVEGGRGHPDRVEQRLSDALAPVMEGQALAADAIAACERISVAVSCGALMAALHEAGRLSVRAVAARDELRAMAEALEPRRPTVA